MALKCSRCNESPTKHYARRPCEGGEWRGVRPRRGRSNGFSAGEVLLMARMIGGVLVGADISGLARHKDFPSVARKFARMKDGVAQDRARRQAEALRRAAVEHKDLS